MISNLKQQPKNINTIKTKNNIKIYNAKITKKPKIYSNKLTF